MCRAGGPRCKGSGGRRNAQASTGTAVAERPAKPAKSTVPTREDADRLAEQLPADRRGWDGSPLNERDRRFFALRESGWTGPIDQDGYPVPEGSEPDLHRMRRDWERSRVDPEQAEILRQMARDRGEEPDW